MLEAQNKPQMIIPKNYLRLLIIILSLVAFNYVVSPNLFLGVENSAEAGLFWADEAIHLKTLEKIENDQKFTILHRSYTDLYIRLSYYFSKIISHGSSPTPSVSFVFGSQLISLISMNVYLLLSFFCFYYVFSSFLWAWISLIMLMGLRINLLFATRMHPEALMICFIAMTIFSATLFFNKGDKKYLWLMAVGTGLAIAAKPQSVFLLVWNFIIFLSTLYKFRIKTWHIILKMVIESGVILTMTLMVGLPYRLMHFNEWINGILTESKYTEISWLSRSRWEWLEIIASGKFLGQYFTGLFLLSLIVGGYHLFKQLYRKHKNIFEYLPESFYFINLAWVFIGGIYVVLGRSFIHRYLIHVQISIIFSTIIGLYWLTGYLSIKYRRIITVILGIVIFAGIHDHWRNTRRDIEFREKIADKLPDYRKFDKDIKKLIPQNGKILYTPIGTYLDTEWFDSAYVADVVILPLIESEKIEYLVINTRYLPAMRYEGLKPVGEREEQIQKTIKFWKNLEKNHVNGEYQLLKHYPELEIKIYQKLPHPY